MRRILSPKVLPWIIAGIAAAVLASAHILQANGWPPCELCLRQRIPYWTGIPIAAIAGILVLPQLARPQLSALLMAAAALTFLVGAGLGLQHVGVEQGWWKSTCSGSGSGDISDLMNSIGKTPITQCDEKRPFLFGLTLATYNLMVSLGLAALAASVPWRNMRGLKTKVR